MFDLRKTLIPLKRIFLTTALFIAVTAVGVIGGRDAKAAIVDLAFALDASGSVSLSDYQDAAEALSIALGQIPTSGPTQYNLGVISFASSTASIVAPQIVTAANKAAIQAAVKNAAKAGGGTCMSCAINTIVADFGGSTGISGSQSSLINITTDGFPNSQTNTTAAAAAAAAAGWDGLSFEAIGNFTADTFMEGIAFPTPAVTIPSGGAIPDPAVKGFVLKVANFQDYRAAIAAKVKAIVKPPAVPVPAAVWLFGTALLGFIGVSRRRKVA